MHPQIELSFEDRGRVARLRLAAPPLNILTRQINRDVLAAIRAVENRKTQYLILESGLPGVFSAGVSIPEHQPALVKLMLSAFHAIFRALHASPLITFALVDGHCYGGGAELALFCDFVFISSRSRIGFPEIKLGCLPPIASLILPGLTGRRRAMDLLLSGRTLTAPQALAAGLATACLPARTFARSAATAVQEITSLSAAAQRHARAALRLADADAPQFSTRLTRVERLYLKTLMNTQDADEGIAAFLEKRPPRWLDR